jgi:hypothetical protein
MPDISKKLEMSVAFASGNAQNTILVDVMHHQHLFTLIFHLNSFVESHLYSCSTYHLVAIITCMQLDAKWSRGQSETSCPCFKDDFALEI